MIKIRESHQRGRAEHGWLSSRHTFSFGDYQDPAHKGYRVLRVINEDYVQPGQGFGTHGHRDMEIISYIIGGALEHKDSLGNGSVIRTGDVQTMSAGSGVTHSEFNHSQTDLVHFLQIWILPEVNNSEPRYAQIHVSEQEKTNQWKVLVSPSGEQGSIAIRQQAQIFARVFAAREKATYKILSHRFAWIQLIDGKIKVNGYKMEAGDGASVEQVTQIEIESEERSHLLILDLP